MAHQSLYRRYRPRRFGEVRGQHHVVRALQNAVRTNTQGHAYLFSGPRGTGKTSTARILAKALNCEDLRDGEPCCECSACLEMEAGRSFDLFELDAASNNGVDSIRDLVERAAVGSPGRTKVYILDEVHMLSTGASNALLKTLEEPPEHVVFVLATTDPQKVLPTVRSRTQHFEFQLLSAKELTDYVHWIAQDASLDLDEESVAYVVRQGKGSARDTLSALDQVVAAGGVITREAPVDRLLRALDDRDSGSAVLAVSDALGFGHDPRVLAEGLLNELRDAFLLSLGVELSHLAEADVQRLGEWAATLGTPTLTRAMEAVGAAMVDMRQAADPRVPLDVALVRLCSGAGAGAGAGGSPGAGGGPGAGAGSSAGTGNAADDPIVAQLVRRVDALERALAHGVGGVAGVAGDEAPVRRSVAAPEADAPRRRPESTDGPALDAGAAPSEAAPSETAPSEAAVADGPSRARAALGAVRAGKGDAPSRPAEQPAARGGPAAPGPPPAAPAPRSPSSPERPTRTDPAQVGQPARGPQPDRDADSPDRDAIPAAASSGSTQPDSVPPAPGSDVAAQAAGATTGPDPSTLASAMTDVVLPQLKGLAKAIFSGGTFVAVTDRGAVFSMENAATIERAERFRSEVESALSSHFEAPITLVLVDGTDRVAVEQATRGARTSSGSTPSGSTPSGSTPSGSTSSGSTPSGSTSSGSTSSGSTPSEAAPDRSIDSSRGTSTPSRSAHDAAGAPARAPAPPVSPDPAPIASTPRTPEPSAQPGGHLDDAAAGPGEHADDDESSIIDVHDLEDADVAATGVEKLTKAFPGAVLVDGNEGAP